jgi:pimeloyl-ACP methyl ester carboxylesterase
VGWKVSQEVASLATDRSDYASIAVPTLVLGGSLTPAVERRVVERLATTLPNATARILPGLGHMGPITHAPQVNALLAAHLDAASP